ncbi:MAG: DUF1801 domain-containing protein [Bacteroidales bacterium]
MRTTGIPENTDEYIAGFPENIQRKLNDLRAAIRKAAPGAEESISYRMPAYKLNGVLVYFAAQKNHIGFYPTSSGVIAFKKELAEYKTSKGAVQFPLDKPIPLKLVSTIVKFRVKENSERIKSIKKKL